MNPLTYLKKAMALIGLATLIVAMPVVAWAQSDGVLTPEGLEIELLAFAPVVVLVASLFLKEETVSYMKKLIPPVISVLIAVVYFVVDVFPGFGETLLVNLGLMFGLVKSFYEPISGLVEMLRGAGRGLNASTPTIATVEGGQ